MRHHPVLLIFAILAAVGLGGCGGDDPVTPPDSPNDGTSLVHGDIDASATSFEFASEVNLDLPLPPPGPFRIRGEIQGYDTDLGALVVDVVVVNIGERIYPEPANLTLVQLLPPDVTVLDADNGESGVGASFRLGFTNDDAMWVPGEESLPRTVRFVVAAGTSIGFAARIDVGLDPLGGAIGGLVWHDRDEDGVVDVDESGLDGAEIRINGAEDQHWTTTTTRDGNYRVDGLQPGYYTVVRLPNPRLRPTTPSQLQVVLVEREGGVSDFLAANFGCRTVTAEDPIAVGDCLHAKGAYAGSPSRLVAELYCICGRDDDDGDDGSACWNRLTGPVTEVNAAGNAVAIMGTWLHVPDDVFELDDVAVSDRLRAGVEVVADDDGHHLEACSLHGFSGHFDRIRGPVQEVFLNDDDDVVAVRVLDTRIDLSQARNDCDDDDDDDEDDDD